MTLDEALAPFRAVLESPVPGDAAGWIGLDVPLELFDAAGVTSVRIVADPAAANPAAAAYGEGGGHPEIRALVSRLADGSLDQLSQVVIGATPVTGVWLYNFLLSLGPDRPGGGRWSLELFDLARNERASARCYDVESVRRLAERLAWPVAAPELRAAIRARNELRALLRRVEALRVGPEPRLSGGGARTLFDAVDAGPPDLACSLVKAFLDGADALPVLGGVPVIYSGTAACSRALYAALEAEGLRVVGDDQDFGSRAIGPDVAEDGDPFEALAERYRDRRPAAAGWSSRERAAELAWLATERGAQGVVLLAAPFDHPSGWDQPPELAALRAAGIACAVVAPADWRDPAAAARAAADALIPERARRSVHG